MAYSIALPDLPIQIEDLALLRAALPNTVGCQTAAPEIPVVLDDVFGVVPTALAFAPVAIATAQGNPVQVVTKITVRQAAKSSGVDVTTIKAADWSHKVGSYGEIVQGLEDIAQCIRIILTTPKGSVPHRPQFGCDAWRYLDHPETQSLPHVIRECTDAVATWEPRATVTKITASYGLAQVNLVVHWTANVKGSAGQSTQVAYALTAVQ